MFAGDQDNISSPAAITSAGTASRNEFLASESETSITTISGFDGDGYFIYEHGIDL